MARFIAQRFLLTLPVLWGITVVIFLLVAILPGDIVDILLPANSGATEAEREALREELGLSLPSYERYVLWLGDTVRGDLGFSLQFRLPVADLIWQKLQNSLVLAGAAFVLSTVLGVAAGVFAGTRPNSLADRSITTLSVLAASVPQYWLGLMLMLVFTTSARRGRRACTSGP